VSFLKMPSSSTLFISLTATVWTPTSDCLRWCCTCLGGVQCLLVRRLEL
jgi:hypothetical protein